MMPAQVWLSTLKYSRIRVAGLMEQIVQLQSQTQRLTQSFDDIGGGHVHHHDSMERTICKLADMKDELQHQIDSQIVLQMKISNAIREVKSQDQRQVLYDRYVLDKPFTEIASRMGKSERYIYSLHGYGLKAINVPEDVML